MKLAIVFSLCATIIMGCASVDIDTKNSKSATALMVASLNGHAEIVQALLAKGVNINIQANDGETALMAASQEGHAEIVKALLAKGAKR